MVSVHLSRVLAQVLENYENHQEEHLAGALTPSQCRAALDNSEQAAFTVALYYDDFLLTTRSSPFSDIKERDAATRSAGRSHAHAARDSRRCADTL